MGRPKPKYQVILWLPVLVLLVIPRLRASEYGPAMIAEGYDENLEEPRCAAEAASAGPKGTIRTKRWGHPADPLPPSQEICKEEMDPVMTMMLSASMLSILMTAENETILPGAATIPPAGSSTPLVWSSNSPR
jgi:hypothetical protein